MFCCGCRVLSDKPYTPGLFDFIQSQDAQCLEIAPPPSLASWSFSAGAPRSRSRFTASAEPTVHRRSSITPSSSCRSAGTNSMGGGIKRLTWRTWQPVGFPLQLLTDGNDATARIAGSPWFTLANVFNYTNQHTMPPGLYILKLSVQTDQNTHRLRRSISVVY